MGQYIDIYPIIMFFTTTKNYFLLLLEYFQYNNITKKFIYII